jgi:hypothetical protein
MHTFWKASLIVWGIALSLALLLTLVFGTGARQTVYSMPLDTVHQQPIAEDDDADETDGADEELDLSGTRYRCVVCHSNYTHEVVMPHPLNPSCRDCHSGSPSTIGCPSCHSMHMVDYPHTTYPTCDECHAGEDVETAQVDTTAVEFAAYLFRHPDFFLWNDSALE